MKKKFLKQLGFSLIETMVAILILSTVFVSLMYVFPFGISINKGAKNATNAAYLAQEKIESLVSQGYDNLLTGVVEDKHRLSSDPNNFLYQYQRHTVINYVDGNLQTSATDLGMKKITTNLYYTDAISKQEKTYSIITILSQQ